MLLFKIDVCLHVLAILAAVIHQMMPFVFFVVASVFIIKIL